MYIVAHESLTRKGLNMTSSGVMDVVPNRPINVC